MRFSNAKEMYEYLNSGHDLYHPESGIYVFSYNDRGALCKYCLSKDQVKEISERSKQIMMNTGELFLSLEEKF